MIDQPDEHGSTTRDRLLAEVMRHVSTQAAILAGFAFTAIAGTLQDGSEQSTAYAVFIIAAALALGFEVLAMFTAGLLGFVAKVASITHFSGSFTVPWFSYLIGAILFLVAVAGIAWAKFFMVAWVVTGICAVVAIVCIVVLASIGTQASRM